MDSNSPYQQLQCQQQEENSDDEGQDDDDYEADDDNTDDADGCFSNVKVAGSFDGNNGCLV